MPLVEPGKKKHTRPQLNASCWTIPTALRILVPQFEVSNLPVEIPTPPMEGPMIPRVRKNNNTVFSSQTRLGSARVHPSGLSAVGSQVVLRHIVHVEDDFLRASANGNTNVRSSSFCVANH